MSTYQPNANRASLFVTCIIDQLYPEVGEATVRVLQRLGVDVNFPSSQTCCGQPAFNSGYWSLAKPLAKRFLKIFDGDRYIVAPSGSCASMVRIFYKQLFNDEPQVLEQVESVGSRVFELSEFIYDILGVTDLSEFIDPASESGKQLVTYHEACHLRRELGATTQPRALIKSLTDVELQEMKQSEVCCGFGGTFSVKYNDISGAMLNDKVNNIAETNASSVVACDSSCLMQIAGGIEKQNLNVRSIHLAQLLDQYVGKSNPS